MPHYTLSKVYLEITNVCNLACSFCHGTKREKSFMGYEDFCKIVEKLTGKAEYLYLHLLGEPLLHPDVARMAAFAKSSGFKVMLTTNGTLLHKRGEFILDANVFKVSISLHSFGANEENGVLLSEYIYDCADFAKRCAERGVICVFRLWNLEEGANPYEMSESKANNAGNIDKVDNADNAEILSLLHKCFPGGWIKNRSGYKLINAPKGEQEVYLEYGDRFEWPDVGETEKGNVENADINDKTISSSTPPTFCYALRDQIGVLCNGTVVPCCLDADGEIALGNLLCKDSSLEEILEGSRARRLYNGFTEHIACEALCKSCGYATRYNGKI